MSDKEFKNLLTRNTKIVVTAEGIDYDSRIEDITKNRLLITVPTRQGKPMPAKKGTMLTAAIILPDGRVVFDSFVQDTVAKHIHMYAIDLPKNMTKKQLRQYFRVDVHMYVNVFLGTIDMLNEKLDDDKKVEYTKVLVDNLSGGGCRITVDKMIPVSKHCVFDFSNYDMEGLEFVPAVGTRAIYRKEASKKHISFKFNDLIDTDRDKIVRYVFRRQLEARKMMAELE